MLSIKRNNQGFSFVELLVVMGVLVSLVGVSVSSFINFRDKRRALEDAKIVFEEMRKIRSKVMAVEIPPGCVTVLNYTLRMSANSKSMITDVTCQTGSVSGYFSNNLLDAVFTDNASVVFGADGTVSGSGSVSVCNAKHKFSVSISSTGVISGPVESLSGC